MPQKIFEPFKWLPHQLQNLNLIQKLQGLSLGKSADSFGSYLAGSFGCLDSPSAIAFDEKLGLLVVGSKKGVIRIYGTPGFVLTARSAGSGVLQLLFLPEEGRFVATFMDGGLSLFELDPRNGGWSERSNLHITNPTNEQITSLALGHGVIYVGSSTGVLYQVAVKNGRLCLGDPTLTSLTSAMVLESVPLEKRDGLGVDSPIVALQYQPEGSLLLVAYSGGCVAVVIPQPVAEANGSEKPTHDAAASTGQEATDATATAEAEQAQVDPKPDQPEGDGDSSAQQTPGTPLKGQSEKRTTLKLKEFTRSLRRFEMGKHEVEDEPPLPVPPSPRVSHILLRDQPVEWATWRITAPGVASSEITVAYGDGAFQVWPISAPIMKEDIPEVVMVSKRDPPSTPYGPLPCGAINKITQCPGLGSGVTFTVFSGGLPRAEFDDRHAVSVLQDPEHHVCFQFGSKVVDFILLSPKVEHSAESDNAETAVEEHITRPSSVAPYASALLVLTERELVAIDLQHPNWPTFSSPYLNCLDLSPVTAIAHVTKVSSTLFSRLRDNACNYSTEVTRAQWPIWGGANGTAGAVADLSHNDCNDVLILGHANGWITLLGVGRGDAMHRLGTLRTELLFNLADGPGTGTVELETWPPFRRVGDCALAEPFCPQTPDSRLALTQLVAYVGADSMTIVAGGQAGQVSVWSIDEHGPVVKPCFEPDISRVVVHLTEEDPANPIYVWDGPPALKPFEGAARGCGGMSAGFSPCALIQLDPPAPVTALALELSWNLLAVGCPFGFAVIDTLANSAVQTDLTLPGPAEQAVRKLSRGMNVSSVQTALTNRGKQISAQLRQSFRRLKNLRTSTSTAPPDEAAAPNADTTASGEAPKSEPSIEAQPDVQPTSADVKPTEPTEQISTEPQADAPVPSAEPAVETTDDVAATAPSPPQPIHLTAEEPRGYAVRCLLFADTYVISPIPATAQQPGVPSPRTPCLWVGTASGKAFAYGLKWDGTSGPVTVQLHKELQLQHRAPVIGLLVLDGHNKSPILKSSRTRTGYLSEIQTAEPAAPTTTDESADPSNTSKEAATPAQPVTTSPSESHQLLLCSEEQVKIFQLPTLRALHKFKFIDRLRLPGHHGGQSTGATASSAASTNASSEQPAATTTTPEAEKDDAESKPCATPAEVEPKSPHPAPQPQPNRKSVCAFGVQAFVRPCIGGAADQVKTEWNVVVTRHDGHIVILSVSHLRKLFKVKPATTEMEPARCVPCVASLVDTNYVFWQSGCQLHAYELSPTAPHLTSPALFVPGSCATVAAPLATITLPVWARPQQATAPGDSKAGADGDAAATSANGLGPDTADVPLIDDTSEVVGHVVNGAAEVQVGREIETAHPLGETYSPAAALHAGDVTIDSIKEYLNGEGTVTIKTIETSTEKRTLVEGGHVVTTVRETECVDGQITKDDMLKFSTEDAVASQAAVESS